MTIFWKESSIRFRGVSLYVCLHIYFHSKSTAELQYFSNKELLVRFFWNRLSHYLLLLNDHVLDIACATFSVIYHEDYSNDYAIFATHFNKSFHLFEYFLFVIFNLAFLQHLFVFVHHVLLFVMFRLVFDISDNGGYLIF